MPIRNRYILFGLILLFNIGFFVAAILLLPILFEENDDALMCMIANGVYSGTPDCHLVFINALWGSMLAWLYSLTTAVEWYTVTLGIVQIMSVSVIAYYILQDREQIWWYRIGWMLLLYVLWVRIILSLQFTTTAGIACVAGCIVLITSAKGYGIIGGGYILISSLIRFEVTGLVMLLFAPLFWYKIRRNYKQYIPIVIVAILVIGCKYADKLFYSSPEWSYYKEYNEVRGHINDNPNAYQLDVEDALPQGLTLSDYEQLLSFYPDPTIMNLEVLKQIYKPIQSVSLKEKMNNLWYLKTYATALCILFLLVALTFWGLNDWRERLFVALYALFVIGVLCGIALDGTLKNRVFLCVLMASMSTLYCLPTKNTTLYNALCIVLLGILSFKYAKQSGKVLPANKEKAEIVWKQQQLPILTAIPQDCYIGVLGAQLNIEAISPFAIKDFPCHLYATGWMTSSPLNDFAKSYQDLVDSNIYLFFKLQDGKSELLTTLQQHISTHYGIQTTTDIVAGNSDYEIIQLKRVIN